MSVEGTPGLTLRGPKGTVAIDHGVILAHSHVHIHPEDARRFGVIRVRVEGERETVFVTSSSG